MHKGQWSSTKAMKNYLHGSDELRQQVQQKRLARRAKNAARKAADGGTKIGSNQPICQNDAAGFVRMNSASPHKQLKTLERVKRSDSNSAIRITIIYHRVR
jgi:hypothetical protein